MIEGNAPARLVDELIAATTGLGPDRTALFLGRLVHSLAATGVITVEEYRSAAAWARGDGDTVTTTDRPLPT